MIWLILIIVALLLIWLAIRGKVFIPDENTKGEKIMKIEVAGRKYHTAKVKPDELVRLSHDPANEHDPNAIEILKLNGKLVGYVPRKKNKKLVQLMKGSDLYGKVIAVYYRGTEIHVDIYKHTPPN